MHVHLTTRANATRTVGLATGAAACVTLVCAVLVRFGQDPRWSVAGLWALGLLLAWPIVSRMGQRQMGPWGPAVAAMSLVSLAPLFALGALGAAGIPIIDSGDRRFAAIAAATLLPELIVGAPLLGAAISAELLHQSWRSTSRWLFIVAAVLSVASAFVVDEAMVRARNRPDPDRYLASLPIVGRAPPAGEDDGVWDTTLEDVTVRRRCARGSCTVELYPPSAVPPPTPGGDGWITAGRTVDAADALLLRRDTSETWWVAEAGAKTWLAFHEGEPVATTMDVTDVASSLSPPIGWVAAGAGGLAIAVLLLLSSLAEPRELAWIGRARAGVVELEGDAIRFDDGVAPIRALLAKKLPPGPALARSPGPVRWPTYRHDGSCGAWLAVSGTREQLVAGAHATLVARRALAVAVLSWTLPPLLLCWKMGLL